MFLPQWQRPSLTSIQNNGQNYSSLHKYAYNLNLKIVVFCDVMQCRLYRINTFGVKHEGRGTEIQSLLCVCVCVCGHIRDWISGNWSPTKDKNPTTCRKLYLLPSSGEMCTRKNTLWGAPPKVLVSISGQKRRVCLCAFKVRKKAYPVPEILWQPKFQARLLTYNIVGILQSWVDNHTHSFYTFLVT